AATSGDMTRSPATSARARLVSYGVSVAKSTRSIRTVGYDTPPLTTMPMSLARAAGLSPELPIADANDGVIEAHGDPQRCQPRWISRNAWSSRRLLMRLSCARRRWVLNSQPYTV